MTKKLYIGLIIKRWYSRLLKRIISRPHTLKALLITLKIKKKIISIHYSHRMYPCNQTTTKRKSRKLTWIEKNPLSSIFPEGCWNHMKVKQTNKQMLQDSVCLMCHTKRTFQIKDCQSMSLTCRNVLYSSLASPPSAIRILSSSSSWWAMEDRSTGVKYSPCSRLLRQCWAQREPSCYKCRIRVSQNERKKSDAPWCINILQIQLLKTVS